VRVLSTPKANLERVQFNFAANRDMTDPASVHPVLGEVAVRRALVLATPKQELVDKLLYGRGQIGRSAIPAGWAAPNDVIQEGYDPPKARQLLDQAGWISGGDGIRVKNGVRASVAISTTEGDATRAHIEDILVDAYRQIGVELTIRNASIKALTAPWSDGGVGARGNFDLLMLTFPTGIDPQPIMTTLYRSSSIPSASTALANYMRFNSAEFDRLLDEAGSTPDLAKRKAAYAKALRLLNDAVVSIWLYTHDELDAYRIGVTGWSSFRWDNLTWNTEDWYLTPSR
jgi:peptide/nickel transport system substrate-binding protein